MQEDTTTGFEEERPEDDIVELFRDITKSEISVHDADFGKWEPSILRHKDPFDNRANYTEIASRGNILPIGGLPKTMKTTVKQAIITSAYLPPEDPGSAVRTLGFQLNIPKGSLIVDVDTEQSKKWCDLYYKNLASMIGCYIGKNEDNTDVPNYIIKKMRGDNPKERIRKIDRIVREFGSDIGVLCIDGIADLIYDENNRKESKDIVSKCMKWTDEFNILLITNIHLTEGAPRTKLTGVLGTELQKKMDASLICHMHDDEDKRNPIVRIESWRTRGPGISDLLFKRDKRQRFRGFPQLLPPDGLD